MIKILEVIRREGMIFLDTITFGMPLIAYRIVITVPVVTNLIGITSDHFEYKFTLIRYENTWTGLARLMSM